MSGACRIIQIAMKSRWSSTTKRVVIGSLAAVFLLFIWRAGDIVEPFLWAMILSYILLPLVGALQHRTGLPRTGAALVVFLALLAFIFGGGRFLIPRLIDNTKDLRVTHVLDALNDILAPHIFPCEISTSMAFIFEEMPF